MHLWVARHAVEELRHLQGRPVRLFVKGQVSVFRTRAQHFNQTSAAARRRFTGYPTAAKTPGKMVGELPHFAFTDAQHLGNLGEGAASLERRKPSDHGAMFAAVFLEDELHHVVPEVVREINVDVRQFVQRHALLVEEAAKVEIETDRANAADAKAVADQTVCRAAARNPLNAAPPAVLKKIPGDKKVFLVAYFVNDAQFHFDLGSGVRGLGSGVTTAESFKDKPPQEPARR